MSLPSLILALLSPLAAKLNPKPQQATKRELELEAEVKRLTFALEHWRTSCNALWDESHRQRAEIADLRHSRQRAQAFFQEQFAAQHQQQAQHNAQNLQQSLAQQNAVYAQQQNINPLSQVVDYRVCNCTPGRSSLFAPDA
jgi:hypothetical protein